MCPEDDELFRAIVDWFPFETTRGVATLAELRKRMPVVGYAATVDGYRQIAQVVAAEGIAIVNAGYIHDAEPREECPR